MCLLLEEAAATIDSKRGLRSVTAWPNDINARLPDYYVLNDRCYMGLTVRIFSSHLVSSKFRSVKESYNTFYDYLQQIDIT